ncbi:MAG: RHS repeat-associated core domain-containing protein, partial [Mycoplasmatales bacterium]
NDTKYVLDYTQEHTKLLATYKGTTQTNAYVYDQFEQLKSNSQNYYDVDGNNNVIGQLAKTNPTSYTKQVTYDNHGKPSINLENEFGYRSEMHTAGNQQYLRFREYDTSIGAFTKRDTYPGVQDRINSQNRYIYAENDPINGSDPSGHAWWSNAWNGLKKAAKKTWNAVKKTANWAWNGVKKVATNVWNGVKQAASNVWNGIKSGVSWAWNGIKTAATNSWNWASDQWNSFRSGNTRVNYKTSAYNPQAEAELQAYVRNQQLKKEINSLIAGNPKLSAIHKELSKRKLSYTEILRILKFCEKQGYDKYVAKNAEGKYKVNLDQLLHDEEVKKNEGLLYMVADTLGAIPGLDIFGDAAGFFIALSKGDIANMIAYAAAFAIPAFPGAAVLAKLGIKESIQLAIKANKQLAKIFGFTDEVAGSVPTSKPKPKPDTPNPSQKPKPDSNVGSDKINILPSTKLNEINEYVKYVDDHKGNPPQGKKGGSLYDNDPEKFGNSKGQKLPVGTVYKEYRVNNIPGSEERIVIGENGSVWYTNDHYITFTKIR